MTAVIQRETAKSSAQPGTAALERVTQHHARTCTFWIFSGSRACSCGVIAARLELAKIRELGRIVTAGKKKGRLANGEM